KHETAPTPRPASGRGRTGGLGEASRNVAGPLLQFDGSALGFELLLDALGFLLGHAFLYGAGRGFHQVLGLLEAQVGDRPDLFDQDRKSTRLNSSHVSSSYAVFCLKKKTV